MQDSLKTILSIQELDIKMIRLMRVKKERQRELEKIHALKRDIEKQVNDKEAQVTDIKKDIRMGETQIKEVQDKVSRLEEQQAAVKKMDEFNALTQEMTQAGRDKTQIEHRLSDLMDKQSAEEDLLIALRENLKSTEESSIALEKEINDSIAKINEEGRVLLQERGKLIPECDLQIFKIYERLLKNKKDRVVVQIESRTCSGCHIVLTAQHENLVRKGDRLVFCEHCSRILYWHDVAEAVVEDEEAAPRKRRRRATASI
ncbi:MAG: zinc ribbon domain regulatory protein CdsZ [Chlamydiales bacterium]